MEIVRVGGVGGGGGGGGEQDEEEAGEHRKQAESNRLRAWHSSRIFRVSRASGGKDRHSKVFTAKGLRDRRVRLSVSTAIQFYDLQDRLGYDQPSKAVEWLIKAAADAIAELPSLDSRFPELANEASEDETRAAATGRLSGFEAELENDTSFQQQHHISLSKSACSSTSETSKGSVLSLSRSESRVKARERARERAAKDKDIEQAGPGPGPGTGHQHNSENSSYTELLTSGVGGTNSHRQNHSTPQDHGSPAFFLKQPRHSPPNQTSMDYFSTGLFGPASSSRNHFTSGTYSTQPHYGNAPQFSLTNDHHDHHHHELQQFSFLPDQLIPDDQPGDVIATGYNLDFSISSGIAGYNRGTLQSNSSSQLPPPHLQRYSGDGSSMRYYANAATDPNAAPTSENQFSAGFDGRLQLCYGDRHSDSKGKQKH